MTQTTVFCGLSPAMSRLLPQRALRKDLSRFLGVVFDFGHNDPNARFLDLVRLPPGPMSLDTRTVRRFHPSWMYCSLRNCSHEPLFVYGPRHDLDYTTTPTSLFLLPPGQRTPRRWDCKGLLIPSGRTAVVGASIVEGPIVLKYRDLRRVKIDIVGGCYRCPKSNGILATGQMDYAVPDESYEHLLDFPRCRVSVGSA